MQPLVTSSLARASIKAAGTDAKLCSERKIVEKYTF